MGDGLAKTIVGTGMGDGRWETGDGRREMVYTVQEAST
jgi:hypothetical protein